MFSWAIGWSYNGSCIAGPMRTGNLDPIYVAATVVAGGSSIPDANFPIVLAVAGAMRTRSTCPELFPARAMCSSLPVSSRTTGFPVAHSRRSDPIIFSVDGEMTAYTSAPCLISSRAISGTLNEATLLDTRSAIFFPESCVPEVPVMSLEGCVISELFLFLQLSTVIGPVEKLNDLVKTILSSTRGHSFENVGQAR